MVSLGRILGTPFRLAGRVPQAIIDIFDKDDPSGSPGRRASPPEITDEDRIREFQQQQEDYRYVDPENPRGAQSRISEEELVQRALQSGDVASRLSSIQAMRDILKQDPYGESEREIAQLVQFIQQMRARQRPAAAQGGEGPLPQSKQARY